jgi:hypothetical protein
MDGPLLLESDLRSGRESATPAGFDNAMGRD